MKKVFSLSVQCIKPDRESVFQSMGLNETIKPSDRILELFDLSMGIFKELTKPIGIMAEISNKDFIQVYNSAGTKNEKNTPLSIIYPQARKLALLAFTLGEEISWKISQLFETRDFALGAMLDAIASQAAEWASRVAEEKFLEFFPFEYTDNSSAVVLHYSPGYCGWHISGQKGLFEYLQPADIGIHLTDQFLMIPLKSISGVLVAAERTAHLIKNTFRFCNSCTHHSCIQRINRLKQNVKETNHGDCESDFTIFATGR